MNTIGSVEKKMPLDLRRSHDFQIHLSPTTDHPAAVNPPSFNWPEKTPTQPYSLELVNQTSGEAWRWESVRSPFQPDLLLSAGAYRWRLSASSPSGVSQSSEWLKFEIDGGLAHYRAPSAAAVFECCDRLDQWLMYLDEDVLQVQAGAPGAYERLKRTAQAAVPVSQVVYPDHYLRGHEEGRRTAIGNVRRWIDRDLVAHLLLFRIWGEQSHGDEAVRRLLRLAEWSPEGPASLLRPCTWGDEVGLSLSRNLFVAYHWLSPLLNAHEKAFVRPMLIRMARQMRERLEQDDFKQHPGHSHTSRLPGYLGMAALALYREHDRTECEAWLNYALMIYRGVLPFYGGADGSWAEGPFYASSYTKWFHPFFLSIERLTGFSFYNHPFYRNFHRFAKDMIAPAQALHPFGDGFWCKRNGHEWPGFFSQNPLRVYAARFGDAEDCQSALDLEEQISEYDLHLLDVVPTVSQLAFVAARRPPPSIRVQERDALNIYYGHGGLGKLVQGPLALYYRASSFGNSSHRHGDQGNIAFFDNGVDILIPTGSYGYRFGSKHHSQWTRQTLAHNLPLVGAQGQLLDDPRAIGRLVCSQSGPAFQMITLALGDAYSDTVARYVRTVILIEDHGVVVIDAIELSAIGPINWRLHSHLDPLLNADDNSVLLRHAMAGFDPYRCEVVSHPEVRPSVESGYPQDLTVEAQEVASDANKQVSHFNWLLPASATHCVIACCVKQGKTWPKVIVAMDDALEAPVVQFEVQQQLISVPVWGA